MTFLRTSRNEHDSFIIHWTYSGVNWAVSMFDRCCLVWNSDHVVCPKSIPRKSQISRFHLFNWSETDENANVIFNSQISRISQRSHQNQSEENENYRLLGNRFAHICSQCHQITFHWTHSMYLLPSVQSSVLSVSFADVCATLSWLPAAKWYLSCAYGLDVLLLCGVVAGVVVCDACPQTF